MDGLPCRQLVLIRSPRKWWMRCAYATLHICRITSLAELAANPTYIKMVDALRLYHPTWRSICKMDNPVGQIRGEFNEHRNLTCLSDGYCSATVGLRRSQSSRLIRPTISEQA